MQSDVQTKTDMTLKARAKTAAPAPSADVTPLPLAKQAKLHGGRMQERAIMQREWFADIPAGVPYEATLQSSFWTHYARKLCPNDLIWVVREDGAWAAQLWVMFSENGEVRLCEYVFRELDGPMTVPHPSEDFVVEYRGPGAKFCIVNRATKKIVKEKLFPRSTAIQALQEMTRRLA